MTVVTTEEEARRWGLEEWWDCSGTVRSQWWSVGWGRVVAEDRSTWLKSAGWKGWVLRMVEQGTDK